MRCKTYKRYLRSSSKSTLYALKGSSIFIIKESDIVDGLKMEDGVYIKKIKDDDYNPTVYVYIPEDHLLFNLDLSQEAIDAIISKKPYAYDYYYDNIRGDIMYPLYKRISIFLNNKAFNNSEERSQ